MKVFMGWRRLLCYESTQDLVVGQTSVSFPKLDKQYFALGNTAVLQCGLVMMWNTEDLREDSSLKASAEYVHWFPGLFWVRSSNSGTKGKHLADRVWPKLQLDGGCSLDVYSCAMEYKHIPQEY